MALIQPDHIKQFCCCHWPPVWIHLVTPCPPPPHPHPPGSPPSPNAPDAPVFFRNSLGGETVRASSLVMMTVRSSYIFHPYDCERSAKLYVCIFYTYVAAYRLCVWPQSATWAPGCDRERSEANLPQAWLGRVVPWGTLWIIYAIWTGWQT